MPIEFSCPQCLRILRVSDEHAGKAARCPDCSMVMQVPGGEPPPQPEPSMQYKFGGVESPVPGTPPLGPRSLPPKSHGSKPNVDPWRAGQAGASAAKRNRDGIVRPTSVSFDEIANYSWKAFQANMGLLIGVNAVVFFLSLFFCITQAIVDEIFQPGAVGGSLQGAVVGLIGSLCSIFVYIGQVRINYDVARYGRADFSKLFSGADKFGPALVASIIAGLVLGLGFVCLIIPGFILLVLFWPYFHLIADYKATTTGSFETAFSLCKLNVGTSIILGLMSFVLLFAGALALLIGLIVAVPVVSMLWSVAYLKMAGQI